MGRQQLISLGSTIKTAYEGENDTNAFTDDDRAYVTDLIDNVTVDDDGNIGIGTTSPDVLLQVGDNSDTSPHEIRLERNAGQDGTIGIGFDANNVGLRMRVDSIEQARIEWGGWATPQNEPLIFASINNGEYMRITSAGNVGIGTTSPQTKLHVDGTVRFDNLPTSDPTSAGALWNDSGTLKISAG